MRIPSLLCCFVILLGMASGAPQARANEDRALALAKQSFTDGRALYLQKRFLEAAAAFLKAYDSKPIAAFLFNAAVAFEKGEAYDDAVKHFRKYLAKAPKATDAGEIQQRIAALEKALAAAKPDPPREGTDPPREGTDPPREGTDPPREGTDPPREGTDPPREGTDPSRPKPKAVVVPVLPKLEPKGVVVVSTKPAGANIYLGSKMNPIGESPWQGTLDTGEHTLLIESKGYKPEKKTITVSPDRLVDVYVALSQDQYLGWVQITANSPGALIFIDDKSVGAVARTPYSGFLKPGKHSIWVSKIGFKEARKEIEVTSGETQKVHFDLKGVEHGWLSVDGTTAQSGEVLLDGKVLCQVPCSKIPVPPGKHRLVITLKGKKPVEHTLLIQRLRETTAQVRLAPKSSRVGAYVAYAVAAGFLAGGVTLGYLSRNLEKDVQKDIDEGAHLVGSNDSRLTRGKIYAWTANGLFGLAGLSAIFGIYYTFADRGPKSSIRISGKNVALVPDLGPGYAGLSGSFRF